MKTAGPTGLLSSLSYTALEVMRGEAASASSDVYSLGCVLFECFAGRAPYVAPPGASVGALLVARLSSPPLTLRQARPDLPPELDEVIRTALAGEVSERFETCNALISAAADVLRGVVRSATAGQVRVRTFLIADVRGYTQFTDERGDEAAALLAERFATVARAAIEQGSGTLLELRGDEALAVFVSARDALRTSLELQRRFAEETRTDPSLPLRVGIGMDAGEALPVQGGYRGGALNLAARLCGRAGAGEVLASQGVVHLARTIEGIRYEDLGELEIKGMAKPVNAVRVVARTE